MCLQHSPWHQRLEMAQEAPNTKVVDSCARQASKQRCDDGNPPYASSVGEAIVPKTRHHGKQSRTEVARGIDGVTVHTAEADPDGNYNQANHRGRQVRSWRRVVFIDDCEYEKKQQSGADELIQESRLRHRREGGEGGEHTCGSLQLRIGLAESRQVIPIDKGGGYEGSGGLRDRVRQHLAPGEA